jgi:hypothetical protein
MLKNGIKMHKKLDLKFEKLQLVIVLLYLNIDEDIIIVTDT